MIHHVHVVASRKKPGPLFTGTAGVPPAMSAKREPILIKGDLLKDFAPAARCGRGRPRSQ